MSFPILTEPYKTLKNWSVKLNSLLTRFENLVQPLEWGEWDAKVDGSGAMNFTVTGVSTARYFRLFNTVFFQCAFQGTLSGTATSFIQVSTPFLVDSSFFDTSYVANIQDGGVIMAGFGIHDTDQTTIRVHRYDGANWSLGTGRRFRVSGFFRRATDG